MGLISPGGENLLDILELRQVLSTYDGVNIYSYYTEKCTYKLEKVSGTAHTYVLRDLGFKQR